MSETVDVTLRIHPHNLKALLRERHPASAIGLSEIATGVYALEAVVPVGFQASRAIVNLAPGNKLDQLTPEEKRQMAEAWEKKHGRSASTANPS